jgi:hypothetical protein
MPASAESSYAPQSAGGGPPFRILQFQTMIAGVPTLVDVEGIVLVDADGRVVFKPGDSSEHLAAILAEVRAIKMQLASLTGLPTDTGASLGG